MAWKPPAPIDTSPEDRARVSGPGMRAFLNIARVWELDFAEVRKLLGMPAAAEFQTWYDAARGEEPLTLETDVLLRISAVLGVYQSLRVLYGSEHEGAGWLRGVNRANPFNGKPPMELVLSGFEPGLMDVRRYLLAKEHGAGEAPNEIDRDFRPYTDADLIWR
ncbi:DUF2384 domain-containing protein (plasmid) [Bosea sp. F3-2]|uniref:MbcA/ParS/Xre antitoxin family protein n=1 Tax=Bosea sp. F3-2 TaxID=2599640 RepID=UPI0011EE1C06|nr:MbcA/ParS/Xre antitoxin family protein [Bosea sp. F3-2]QEL26982.1 DUF2384 domain-containing protein [Bosea sp. F3-2]